MARWWILNRGTRAFASARAKWLNHRTLEVSCHAGRNLVGNPINPAGVEIRLRSILVM